MEQLTATTGLWHNTIVSENGNIRCDIWGNQIVDELQYKVQWGQTTSFVNEAMSAQNEDSCS